MAVAKAGLKRRRTRMLTSPALLSREPFRMADLPRLRVGDGFRFLEGVRVLDLTTSIAGPYATMLLGDLGAEVVKVERPGAGDDSRAWGPPFLDGESLWFSAVNRNKKSITLDITGSEGGQLIRALADRTDIVVINQLPRTAAKLGIDAATLRVDRPALIHVSITGFGLTGERADWACYDLIAEGYSGVMDLTGEPDSPPQKIGTPAADLLAGQDAALAVTAALVKRGRTGAGCAIDVALVDSMTRFLTPRIVPSLVAEEAPRRSGGRDSVIAIYQAFETADEPLTLGLGNDAIWQRFWDVVGEPTMGREPRYRSNADRQAQRAEIVARIAGILRRRRRDEWLELFRQARVPAGPINRLDQVVADEPMRARGLFFALQDGARLVPQVGTGFMVDGAANVPRAAPPRLGQDTRAVLADWLGLDEVRLRQLAERKTI
jgi:crotonobetainyl-CoA:carnitine CoA-transferase CaiB-like acyl-CoA transferase